jgi:predicted ATPase
LIGREDEIALLGRYLIDPEIRLISLVGPPGIGKTRLSLEAARDSLHNFPDGVFFIGLASLDDASLAGSVILQVLGYVEGKNVPPVTQLADSIGEKKILLVLDNCEHLIEEVASLVSTLLSACTQLKILTTSRESLRVSGEWLYPVPALDIPEESSSIDAETAKKFPALIVFCERARAVRPEFILNAENVSAVSSICARLDGLPLAIELIAARTRLMSPRVLLENLNDQFMLSVDGMRALPERQKTLNNAIGWSYNLLSQEEQKLFVYLSVFSGSFTLEAAQTIFSRSFSQKSVADLILSLIDKNLLQSSQDERGQIRLNMLVIIHSFASRRLDESGEKAAMRDQHANYFLELAEEADQHVHGRDQRQWMDRLEAELDNLRSALDRYWTDRQTEKLLRLFAALNWPWVLRWPASEARIWLERIRAIPDTADYPAIYGRVLSTSSRREWLVGNLAEARALLEESRAIWLELKTAGERGLAFVQVLSGQIARYNDGDLKAAASYFEQSFDLYQRCNDQWGMAVSRFGLGCVAYDGSEDDSARAWLQQSLAWFQELGDLWGVGRSAQMLGQLCLKQGLYEEARQYFEQNLRADEGFFKGGTIIALNNLGYLYHHQHQDDQAEAYYEKSLSLSQEFGLKVYAGYNLYMLGILALHRNNYPLATQLFTETFNSHRDYLNQRSIHDFLIGLAAVAASTNQPERAARLYGATEAIVDTADYEISPLNRFEFDSYIQMARDQLGDTKFEALVAEGRTLNMEQAIAFAFESSRTFPRC